MLNTTWIIIFCVGGTALLAGLVAVFFWIRVKYVLPAKTELLVIIDDDQEIVVRVWPKKDLSSVKAIGDKSKKDVEVWTLSQDKHPLAGSYNRSSKTVLGKNRTPTSYYRRGDPAPLEMGRKNMPVVDSPTMEALIKTKIFDVSTYLDEKKLPGWAIILIIVVGIIIIGAVIYFVAQGQATPPEVLP